MNLLAWFNPGRWLLLLAACGAAVAGYYMWADHIGDTREAEVRAVYDDAISALKVDATRKLDEATNASKVLTDKLATFKTVREQTDAKNVATLQSLRTQLGSVRLRDPGAAECRGGGNSATTEAGTSAGLGSDHSTSSAGLLSDTASEFLRAKAVEADTINLAYISCRASLLNDRAVLQP